MPFSLTDFFKQPPKAPDLGLGSDGLKRADLQKIVSSIGKNIDLSKVQNGQGAGLTDEEVAQILASINQRIDKSRGKATTRLRRRGAATGAFRGGQQKVLEGEIESEALGFKSQAASDLLISRSAGRVRERGLDRRLRAQLLESRFQTRSENFRQDQSERGTNVASLINLLLL